MQDDWKICHASASKHLELWVHDRLGWISSAYRLKLELWVHDPPWVDLIGRRTMA